MSTSTRHTPTSALRAATRSAVTRNASVLHAGVLCAGVLCAAGLIACSDGDPGNGGPDTGVDTNEPRVSVVITVEGDAPGEVLAGADECDGGCTLSVVAGSALDIVVTPHPYARVEWEGADCTGSSCQVGTDDDVAVTVRFLLNHNVIFVTSQLVPSAEIGPLATADARCASLASAAGLHHQSWVALLGTAAPCPGAEVGPCGLASRLVDARGFINMDLEAVFDTVDQATSGELWHPVRVDDTGAERLGDVVITGYNSAIAPNPDFNCSDFTSDVGNHGWGLPSSIGSFLWQNNNGPCTLSRRYYCASVDYDTPLEPLTSSGRLAFLSETAWTPGGGIATADAVCQRDACEAGLTGSEDCDQSLGDERTFLALLDTDDAPAGSRFDDSGEDYVRVDGLPYLPVAYLSRSLPQLAPRTGLAILADGTRESASVFVWTGSSGLHCTNWNSTTGNGQQGSYDTVARFLAENTTGPCTLGARLYCLEQ